jgi:hypothetical protein
MSRIKHRLSRLLSQILTISKNDRIGGDRRKRYTEASTNSSVTLPGLIVSWVAQRVSCQDGWWAAMHKTTQRYHVG